MKIYIVVADLGPEGDYVIALYINKEAAELRAAQESAVIREYETED